MEEPFKIDFVGIGASKAGTTWLAHMLEQHPQLCMSVPKEIHYFHDRLSYRNVHLKKSFLKGINWYKKHFNHCRPGLIKGEITPMYSMDPLAAERIKAHNPNVKILYCLRSPVDRIESHYNFAKYFVAKEDRPMDQAVRNESEFLDMSMYFKNLSVYLQHFSREQILLIWFEDIRDRPALLLQQVYTFLGVDPLFQPASMQEKSNPGRISKFKGLQNVIQGINRRLIVLGFSGLVKKLKGAGLGNWVMKINSAPLQKDKMSIQLKEYIIESVKEDVRQLEKWAGKDLSHWL